MIKWIKYFNSNFLFVLNFNFTLKIKKKLFIKNSKKNVFKLYQTNFLIKIYMSFYFLLKN
jgi:hypothetical protein